MAATDWSTRPLNDELGEALRAELLGWPKVRVRSVMGTMAFYRGAHMLGCYINRNLFKKAQKPYWANRPGEPPLVWIRLRVQDARRALKRLEIPLASRESPLATHLPSHSRQAPERLSARDRTLKCNLQKVVANEMLVTANRTLGTTLGCLFCPKWWLLGYAQIGHATSCGRLCPSHASALSDARFGEDR
jgi:hypothetical protein